MASNPSEVKAECSPSFFFAASQLRKQREKVRAFLRARAAIPAMPTGVRLVSWELKEPPVWIESCAVVVDPGQFARATLGELREKLVNPKRKYGWSVPQLIDRLAQVGVIVEVFHEGQ